MLVLELEVTVEKVAVSGAKAATISTMTLTETQCQPGCSDVPWLSVEGRPSSWNEESPCQGE